MLILPLLLVPVLGMSQSIEKACFSVPGGFYEESPTLEIFPFYPQHHIRFTTNGSRPTAQSRLYTEPLLLDGSLYSTSDIYTLNLTPDSVTFVPDSVRHCIVIRAAVFDENDNCISETATNSYFVQTLGCDTHGLPVISLCADSLDLFDYEQGILVPGAFFDANDPQWTGNYFQTGANWEKTANVEFYEPDNEGVNQLAGLRVQGLSSRRYNQKSLKIYAREQYGKKRFEYHFFETIPNDSFKHLTLKPFRASWNQTGINDYLSCRYASSLNVESLASRPAVLFLNGEYWGVYFLHEKPDERYLEDHFGVNPGNVTVLEGWGPKVDCGSPSNFIGLFNWMSEANLEDPEAYAYAASKIDIDNFIDYYIMELFSENKDWPANNVRCWQLGDGKWRWIFFDGDACYRWMSFRAFEYAVYDGDATYPSNRRSTLFFRKLLANYGFRHQFKARFHELLETAFSFEVTGPVFEEIKTALAPEIPLQSERFGFPDGVDTWNQNMNNTRWFLEKRREYLLPVLEEFIQCYEMVDDLQMSFEIFPNPSQGPVTIKIDAERQETMACCVYDVMGRKVYEQTLMLIAGANTVTFDLPSTQGLYFLKVNNRVTKIVRQ